METHINIQNITNHNKYYIKGYSKMLQRNENVDNF